MTLEAMIVVGVGGLLLGALLNVLIIRLPRERTLWGWPRCTRTGEGLAWWQLLPVIGWAIQRGRARNGRSLGWIYPFVEVLTAVVLVLLYAGYHTDLLTFGYLVFVSAVLIVTGAIDWLYRYIYTFFILGAALLAVAASVVVPFLSLRESLLGMLAAGAAFLILFLVARALFPARAAPFGLGDVYLAVFIGAAVGLRHLSMALLYGMLMAGVVAFVLVVAKYLFRSSKVPDYISYGTYLCLGVIVYLIVQ